MNILFENTTMIYPNGTAENLASFSGATAAINHTQQLNDSRSPLNPLSSPAPKDYHDSLTAFNSLRRTAVINANAKKIEAMRNYQNYRSTVFGVTFFVCLILTFIILFSLDFTYKNLAAIIATLVSTAVASLLSGIFVRAKYGDRVPDVNAAVKFNYRFTAEYVLMTSDDDSKIMRYERIRAAENEESYFIQFEGEKYEIDKRGFNCPPQEFKKLMEEKGIRVETYIGQF